MVVHWAKPSKATISAWRLWRIIPVVFGIVVFGGIGVWLLANSHAATPTANLETEDGTLASGATSVTDSGASGGKAIRFGNSATTSFAHPGVLLGTSQLDFVKAKLAAQQEPWKTTYTKMLATKASLGTNDGVVLTSLSYTPHPVTTVQCPSGPATGAPAACNDEINDAVAAYADALVWYYNYNLGSNREAYAQKAIEILNAWSGKLQNHTDNNAPLQASWAAQVFPRAAEILRYEYTPSSGKTALNVTQLTSMLNTAFLPLVNQVWPGGGANWLMSMDDATMNIGVFTNNQTVFNAAVARWRQQVPSIIYASTDTNDGYVNLKGKGYPIPPPGVNWVNPNVSTNTINTYWYFPTHYVNGLEGEACRDPAHMAMGFDAMANAAETARLQGVDLYGEQKTRITTGLELNNGYLVSFLQGTKPSNWACPNAMDPVNNAAWKPAMEIVYNEYANRLGIPLPNTWALLSQYSRASSYKTFLGMDFEELTSAGTP